MAHYRIYLLDDQGRFARARDCEAASDADALAAGLATGNPHGFELWEGSRKVTATTGFELKLEPLRLGVACSPAG